MKAYADLEQSKKLAKILSLESADMWYHYIGINCEKDGSEKNLYFPMIIRDDTSDKDIPCWSLAALINVLTSNCNKQTIEITRGGWLNDGKEFTTEFFISYEDSEDNNFTLHNKELIDTCVDMIEVLHEQKIL